MEKKSKIILVVIGLAVIIGSILWIFVNSNTLDKNSKEKADKNVKSEATIGSGSFKSNVKIISSMVNSKLVSISGNENGACILKFNGSVPEGFNTLVDGDIFFIEPDERLPEGFAGEFKSKEKDSVIVEIPNITEVFKDLHIDTQKSKELEVVGFSANGRSVSRGTNLDTNKDDTGEEEEELDSSIKDAIDDDVLEFHDDIGFDEKGQPYVKKLGITLDGFKPKDNDFVTLNGEILLEDLVFDFKLDIMDFIARDYGLNIYTDYTSNISLDIEANKKIEKDFELVRLKLRTSGIKVGFGESKYKVPIGIDIVFMVGVSGEIYIKGELAVINEGYIEVTNKLEGLKIKNHSNIYGKNYPHKTIKSNQGDIKDKKLKSEVSLGIEGRVKAALNIPVKAKAYISGMEICSGTFRNGVEGTVESNGKVSLISGKKPKLEKGCTIEANLDFVSEFELDGGGIKEELEKINIKLKSDMLIEKELLRFNLFNFKYPNGEIDEDKNDKNQEDVDSNNDGSNAENEIESGGNSKLDFSKLKELTTIYFDFNDDGTKDKVSGFVNKNLNGGPSTEAYIVVFDGENDEIIHVSDIDEGYYYTMDFIGSLDINGDGKEDIFAGYYGGGNNPSAIRPCYFIYKNGKYKLYSDSMDSGADVEILDNFKIKANLLGTGTREIEFDEKTKTKYIENGLFTSEGKLLVENPDIRIYGDGVAFEKNSKGGIDLIAKSRVQWVDTVSENPSNAEAGYADVIMYVQSRHIFNGSSFKIIDSKAIGINDIDNHNYCKYNYEGATWSKGHIDNLVMP